MQSQIRKVYACLDVTCHLHFWQNDQDLLRATADIRIGYRNNITERPWRRKFSTELSPLPKLFLPFLPASVTLFGIYVIKSNERKEDSSKPNCLPFYLTFFPFFFQSIYSPVCADWSPVSAPRAFDVLSARGRTIRAHATRCNVKIASSKAPCSLDLRCTDPTHEVRTDSSNMQLKLLVHQCRYSYFRVNKPTSSEHATPATCLHGHLSQYPQEKQ